MRDMHPLAGKTVVLNEQARCPRGMVVPGAEYRIEDWWQNVAGRSWMDSTGNPAAIQYALRTGLSGADVPTDNEVVYGHIDGIGHLVHVSELGPVKS